jgi:hypothetical protein
MSTVESPRPSLARRTVIVAGAFALTVAARALVNLGFASAWSTLTKTLGAIAAIGVAVAVLLATSLAVALLRGTVTLPARRAQIWVIWAWHQLPYAIRDLLGGRSVSTGRDNQRWPSLQAFEAQDARRGRDPALVQSDYGVGWQDGPRRIERLTYIHSTGEFIAVAVGEEAPVELIATIPSEHQVAALLDPYHYAWLGRGDISWVRRRLHGWRVPVPPRGAWWLEQDQKPPKPWPGPPEPSVRRRTGAYHGRHAIRRNEVTSVDETGQRALYHAVESSPTGFAWGYGGSGPHDLARSILFDRLGYTPQTCIVSRFVSDIVSRLEPAFTLTYEDVDAWIDAHAELFAAHPRAVPLNPYAAGGAYESS